MGFPPPPFLQFDIVDTLNQSEFYNAADDLLQRNSDAGRGGKVIIVDDDGRHTHDELVDRVNRCANVLREFGLGAGHRILLCLIDSIDFHTSFLGAIKAGVVPVPLNTLWTSSDYAHVLIDSGAAVAIVSEARLSILLDAAQSIGWNGRIILSASKTQTNLPLLCRLLDSAIHEQKRFIRDPTTCAFGCIPPDRRASRSSRTPADEHGDDRPAVWARRIGRE